MAPEDSLYLIEADDLEKLQCIAATLQSGSDKMRDEGHKLWLVLRNIINLKEYNNGQNN